MGTGENPDWLGRLSETLLSVHWPDNFNTIIEKLLANQYLERSEIRFLFEDADINTLGELANLVKQSKFGNKVYFNHNVHINQTNICTLACKFCAFRRGKRAEDAYEMDIEQYLYDLSNYSEFVDEVHSTFPWQSVFSNPFLFGSHFFQKTVSSAGLNGEYVYPLEMRDDQTPEPSLRKLFCVRLLGVFQVPQNSKEPCFDVVD